MAHQRSDELSEAWLKVDRAKQHISDLHGQVREFIDGDPYELLTEDEAQTGDKIYRVKVNAEPPKDWGVVLGEIFHNLRSALDLLTWQLVPKPDGNTGFPISNSAKKFGKTGLGKVEGASADAIRLLRALKPYKGGCEPLWWLHKLNIEDKHHLLVPIGAAIETVGLHLTLHTPWGESLQAPRFIGRPGPTDQRFVHIPLEDGMELNRATRASMGNDIALDMDYSYTFDIAFYKTGVLEGESLFPTVMQLADFIERILEIFDRRVFS